MEEYSEEIGDRPLHISDMLQLFVIATRQFSMVYLVVDGLDECDLKQRAQVFEVYATLVNLGSPLGVIKILNSCRSTEDIEKEFKDHIHIRFTEDVTSQDISRFVGETVQSRLDSGDLKLRNMELADLIINTLIDGVGGM